MVCDPMLSVYGPTQPAVLIAKELIKRGYDIHVLSIVISERVAKILKLLGVFPHNLNVRLHFKDESLLWFEAWLWEALLSANSKRCRVGGAVLNFSNTIAVPSAVWFAQGPLTVALDDIKTSLRWHHRLAYKLIAPILRDVDVRFVKRMAGRSKFVIANSTYCASIYEKFGIKVHDIIYSPIDCELFRSTTSTPSRDFVLTYFGKETKFYVVKMVADAGVRIKAFGSKLMTIIPKKLLKHPNIQVLGRISDEKLINLYSNAIFTLFPFTDEYLGYIPIESMACGTPVLTYNRQGPSETVMDGVTGWLVNRDEEIIESTLKLWRGGYDTKMRMNCRRRALFFDVRNIAEKWIKLINSVS